MSGNLRLSEAQLAMIHGSRGTVIKLPPPLEAPIVQACLDLLQRHPSVAWCMRMNTGVAVYGEEDKKRTVRFSEPGVSDIVGQLKDGRFFAVEVKRPGNKPTDEQWEFLEGVAAGGGVAGWVDDVAQLARVIPARVSRPDIPCSVFEARPRARPRKRKAK